MEHIREFSRFASSYDAHTLIQKEVVKELTCKIQNSPKKILDLGSGSGAVCKELLFDYELFVGVDNSVQMCELHPQAENIKLINQNFESEDFFLHVKKYAPFDIIISSSALQWSKDIEKVLQFCQKLSPKILFAIFTEGTFKTIYELSGLKSFLPSSEKLLEVISKYYNVEVETKKYQLHFEDNVSKFRSIKRSGVSGGMRRLNFIQTKNLINNYPLSYLEFEVSFFTCKENL